MLTLGNASVFIFLWSRVWALERLPVCHGKETKGQRARPEIAVTILEPYSTILSMLPLLKHTDVTVMMFDEAPHDVASVTWTLRARQTPTRPSGSRTTRKLFRSVIILNVPDLILVRGEFPTGAAEPKLYLTHSSCTTSAGNSSMRRHHL